MVVYAVADTNGKTRRVALIDKAGRYHVVRVQHSLPAIGDALHGSFPGLGTGQLLDAAGREVQVVFELVNAGQQATLEKLHPTAAG